MIGVKTMLYWGMVLFFLAIIASFLVFGAITFGTLGIAKILLTLVLALFLAGLLGGGGESTQKQRAAREKR